MASKLYPPQVEGILPAFYKTYDKYGELVGAALEIPFGLNRAVAIKEIYGLLLRLKTVSTNTLIYIGFNSTWDLTELIARFDIDAETAATINEGQFYKALLAFVNSDKTIGYWSTVGTIKCVAKPSVSIANFNSTLVNGFIQEFVGVYEQDTTYGDSTEKVETYVFNIYDIDNTLILSSGTLLHNSADDISSSSSLDVFRTNHLVEEGKMYYIEYIVTTLNNLTISSPLYKIMQTESVDIEYPLELHCNNNFDNGYIELYLRGVLNPETGLEQMYTGTFLITRGSDKDNYFEWDEIVRFNMDSGYPSDYLFRDFTVEQGITYKYRIQLFNMHLLYSNPIYLTDINTHKEISVVADFEDMFISDGKRQLKVRYNPKVTSFKNNIPEQKIETIGSKYPFIFRNGHVNYKEFPISGLISYSMDDAMLFLNTEELEEAKILSPTYVRLSSGHITLVDKNENNGKSRHQGHEIIQKVVNNGTAPIVYNVLKQWIPGTEKVYNDTNILGEKIGIVNRVIRQDKNLTTENMMGERYFKLKVLDWLTNGEVKLFRSPGEGNYLVRILNVSMLPNDTLGRMLHTFTGTCYEIDGLTYNNLVQYGIVSENVVSLTEMHWGSNDVNRIIAKYSGYNENSEIGPWNTRYALDKYGKKYQKNEKWVMQTAENWDGFYDIPLNSETVLGFTCSDFAPGDIIEVVYAGIYDTEYIVIGSTGSYNYDFDDRVIISLAVKPNERYNNITDFSRILNYKYEGLQKRKFDTISNITTLTQIAVLYIGHCNKETKEYDNILEPYILRTSSATAADKADNPRFVETLNMIQEHPNIRLSDTVVKFDVLQVEILHAQRRVLIPAFSLGTVFVDENNIVLEPLVTVYALAKEFQANTLYYTLENKQYIPITNLTSFEEGVNYYYKKQQTAGYVLTPFGTGYVNYNTVYKNEGEHIDVVDGDVLLHMIEDSQLYVNKHDIDDINSTLEDDIVTPIDAYSVLLVFNPIIKNGEFVEWQATNIYYDTYTHDWNFSYDPFFSINDDSNADFSGEPNKIYLDDIEEVTFTDLGKLNLLKVGNGAMVEITFLLQIVDYSLEEENKTVQEAKAAYTKAKYDDKQGYFNRMIDYYEKKESDAYLGLEKNFADLLSDVNELAKNSSPNLLTDGEIDISYDEDRIPTSININYDETGIPILDSTGGEYAKIITEVLKVIEDVVGAEPLKAQMLVLLQELFNNLLYGWEDEDIYEYVPAINYNEKEKYYIKDENDEYTEVAVETTTAFNSGNFYIYAPKHHVGLLEDKLAPVSFGTNIPIEVNNQWYSFPINEQTNDIYTVGSLTQGHYGELWWPTRWWPSNYLSNETFKDAYNYSIEIKFREENPNEVTDDTLNRLDKDTSMLIIANDLRYWDTINAILYRIGDIYRTTEKEREVLVPTFNDVKDKNNITLTETEVQDSDPIKTWSWEGNIDKYIKVEDSEKELNLPKYYYNEEEQLYLLIKDSTDIEVLYFKQSDYRKYKNALSNYNSLLYYIENNTYISNILKSLLTNESFNGSTILDILDYILNINRGILYMLLHSPVLDSDESSNITIPVFSDTDENKTITILANKPEIEFLPTPGESLNLLNELTNYNNYNVSISNSDLNNMLVYRYELTTNINEDIANYIYYYKDNTGYHPISIIATGEDNNILYYYEEKNILINKDDDGYWYFLINDNEKQYLYIKTIWYLDILSEKENDGSYSTAVALYNPYATTAAGKVDNGIFIFDNASQEELNIYLRSLNACIDYFKNVADLSFLYSDFWHGKVGSFVEAKDDLLVSFNNLLEIMIPYKFYQVNLKIILDHKDNIFYNGKTITQYLNDLEELIATYRDKKNLWTTVKELTAILLQETPDDKDLKDLYATADYSIKTYTLREINTQAELDNFKLTAPIYLKYKIVEQRYKEIESICLDYKEKYDLAKEKAYDENYNNYLLLRNFIYDLLIYSYYNHTNDTSYQTKYNKIKTSINTYLSHNFSDKIDIDALLSFYKNGENNIKILLGYFTIAELSKELAKSELSAKVEDLNNYDNKLQEYQAMEKDLCEYYITQLGKIEELKNIYQGRSSFVKQLNAIIDKYRQAIASDQGNLLNYIDLMKKIIKKLSELKVTAPTEEDLYTLKVLLTRYLLSLQEYYIIDVEGRYDT